MRSLPLMAAETGIEYYNPCPHLVHARMTDGVHVDEDCKDHVFAALRELATILAEPRPDTPPTIDQAFPDVCAPLRRHYSRLSQERMLQGKLRLEAKKASVDVALDPFYLGRSGTRHLWCCLCDAVATESHLENPTHKRNVSIY